MTPQELKNSILQWVVQGKLVPQDHNDEPAKILLEKIQKEKAELIKQKKIKADKNTSTIFRGDDNLFYETIGKTTTCIQDEIPFDIPDSWEWVRLGEIFTIIRGSSPRPKGSPLYWANCRTEYHWITIKDISLNCNNGVLYDTNEFLTQEGSRLSTFVEKDELIIAVSGSTTGKHCILGISGYIYDGLAAILNPIKIISNKFLQTFFNWKYEKLNSQKIGSAFPNINTDILKNILFPLPPLAEQKRIVEKIESLMPIIDEYGTVYTDLQNLEKNFPDNLKKSLLQWAVQGKLVPQDPTDEPAKILLEKIKKEKAELIKQKKIKADTTSIIFRGEDNLFYETKDGITTCIEKDLPFDIPETWEWVRFKNLVSYSMGKTPTKDADYYWKEGIYPWISIGDMVADDIVYNTKEKITLKAVQEIFTNPIIPKDTLIMSFKLTVGKVSILGIDAYHNEAIISIFPFIDIDRITTKYLFHTLPLLSQYGTTKKAIKGNTLNSTSLDNLFIPVPPLNEQKRIAEQFENIIPFCSRLESKSY